LDDPDVMLGAVEVIDGLGFVADDDGLEELPEGWEEGKGVKYEVDPGDTLEIIVEKSIEDFESAGVGKSGDISEDEDWYGWEADDWYGLALDIAEETHTYEYVVPEDADDAIVAVRYYPESWAWVWTTVWPEELREQREVEGLVSIEVYDGDKGDFVPVGFEWEDGWGAWVSPKTDARLIVEETETDDYEFAYWWDEEGNEEVSESEVLLIDSSGIDADTEIYFSAVYREKPEEVTLDIRADDPHGVKPDIGTHSYEVGEEVGISAHPHAGYGFVKWTGDEEAIEAIEDEYDRETTIVMDDDYEIEPAFDRMVNLRVSTSGGGAVIAPGKIEGPGETIFIEIGTDGENIELSAEPEEGYKFLGWSGDIQNIDDPTSAETSITLEYDPFDDPDLSVKAEFERIEYNLTISSTENGRVEDPGEGEFEYNYGETVNLRAVPEPGQEFGGWTDIDTIANRWAENTTIEMLEDYEILADFRPVHFMIEYIEGEGTVSDDQGKLVECGPDDVPCVENYVGVEKVVFTAEPDDDWKVSEWWDGEGGQTRTLYTDDGSKHIGIEFEPEEETIFEVEIIAPEDGEEFVVGEEVKLDYVVTNIGSVEETEDIELKIDGTLWKTEENVTLEAGENYIGSFIETATESGEFNVSVHSESDTDEITVLVV